MRALSACGSWREFAGPVLPGRDGFAGRRMGIPKGPGGGMFFTGAVIPGIAMSLGQKNVRSAFHFFQSHLHGIKAPVKNIPPPGPFGMPIRLPAKPSRPGSTGPANSRGNHRLTGPAIWLCKAEGMQYVESDENCLRTLYFRDVQLYIGGFSWRSKCISK